MRNKIILTLIILGSFYSCVTPKYTILKHSEFQSLDLDKLGLNYIPLEDEMLAKSAILSNTRPELRAKLREFRDQQTAKVREDKLP